MPPVSMIWQGKGSRGQGAARRSRVTPGWSWTMAMRRLTRELNRADLPTLGLPTIAIVRGPDSGGDVVVDMFGFVQLAKGIADVNAA